jgi:GTPase KRas protein
MVICGNKCDLDKDREVSTQEGKDLAKSYDAPFFETSAKARINVEEAFFAGVREIRRYKKQSEKEISSGSEKKKKGGCIIL